MKKTILALVFALGYSSATLAIGNPNAPKGGVLKLNLGGAPTTLNPLSSTDAYARTVQTNVMDSLLNQNIDTQEWEPALATSWKVSKDGKEFTFVLREGVKWHDGKPLTVEDVKFSFDAILDPTDKYRTAHWKPFYENLESLTIIDNKTVKFKVKTPYFDNFAVAAGLTVVPKHVYENPSEAQKKKLNKTLVGTGAYMLKEFDRSKKIILIKNPDWWGNKEPKQQGRYNFGTIAMRFISDGTIAIRSLETGQIDYMGLMPDEYMRMTNGPKWGKQVHKVKMENKKPRGYGYVAFNQESPLFKSLNVRKAMVHLFDRQKMIEKFLYNLSVPATGPLYLQSDYADKTIKPIPYDPKEAARLLAADGWKDTDGNRVLDKVINGKKVQLSFTIMEPSPEFVKYLTTFQQDAKKVGVDVQVKVVEWNAFLKLVDERKFDAVRLAWGGGGLDWDPKQIWHSASIQNQGSNFISYRNPKVDQLIDQARLDMNKESRVKKLQEVYRMIADDVPYIFLFNGKYNFYGYTDRLGREKDTYTYDVGYDYWWVAK